MTQHTLQQAADAVLDSTVGRAGGAPGVVAMATDARGNLYEGAAGSRELGSDRPMTVDTVMCLFSCTKALTGAMVMQLVEEGLVSLDDAASRYVPDIAAIQVYDGLDADGLPKTRPPRRAITLNDLMLHTAGFGYEFFSPEDLAYRQAKNIPTLIANTYEAIQSVLLFDPGERWNYGCNIDWLGKVVEAVRGKRLGEVMAERLFAPLGMNDTAFVITPSMMQRRASLHMRAADGKLTPVPDLVLPQPPEMDMGGHGLYGTVGDYMKFIRMLLNDGDGANGRVLRAETVQRMSQNGLGALKSGGWVTTNPARRTPASSSRPVEVLGLHLHGQRRGRAHRPPGRVADVGRPRQPLLLDRPQEPHRRLLGHADPALPGRGVLSGLRRFRERGLPHAEALAGPSRSAR